MYTVHKHMDGVCVERYVTLFTINLPILFLLLLKCAHFYKEFLLYTSVHVVSIANQCFGITFLLSIPACIIHYYLLCDRVLVHLQCCRTIFILSVAIRHFTDIVISVDVLQNPADDHAVIHNNKMYKRERYFLLGFFPFFCSLKCWNSLYHQFILKVNGEKPLLPSKYFRSKNVFLADGHWINCTKISSKRKC